MYKRQIFRRAEFGFFGVCVFTWRHTPRFCGQDSRTGDLDRLTMGLRPLRMSWLIVGIAWIGVRSGGRQKGLNVRSGVKVYGGNFGGQPRRAETWPQEQSSRGKPRRLGLCCLGTGSLAADQKGAPRAREGT